MKYLPLVCVLLLAGCQKAEPKPASNATTIEVNVRTVNGEWKVTVVNENPLIAVDNMRTTINEVLKVSSSGESNSL